MPTRTRLLLVLACCISASFATPAHALIMALIPLSDLEKQDFIFIAKVKEILPDKPAMVLVHVENLKGTAPFARMPVGLAGDAEAKKNKHTEIILDRIDKDVPIVVMAKKTGGKYISLGFTNGTWFMMEGRIDKEEGKEVVRWNFLHAEPYLRRTFKGTTEELKTIVVEMVDKKKVPPPPNEKEKEGFGPPIKKNSGTGANFPFAVIQLPFIGLIAALAALFPTVFGGLALFMKRWVAALSTTGFVSMFAAVPMILPGWSAKQWPFSPSGLWLCCALLFSIGAFWSLRRYRKSIETGSSEIMQPRRMDRLCLTLLAFAGTAALLIGTGVGLPIWSNEYWRWVLAGTAAMATGAFFLLTTYWRSRKVPMTGPLRLSPESVMLWVLAGSCAAYGSWEAGKYSHHGVGIVQGGGGIGQPTLSTDAIWKFEPDLGGTVVNTSATPERIYAAVMVNGLTERFGRIYALDPNTGAEQWRFDNDYEKDSDNGMKLAFSAPVFADGRLYFGEGVHTDSNSRLFCLDAATGHKLWDYKTESHTESTPFVANGKVVFGAGYHGIHCLDAIKGPGEDNQPLWRYPPDAKADAKELHVDCNPVIADSKVFAGSGYKPHYVDENGKINTIFCLDLNTGEEIWKERVEDAVYGSPVVRENRVFFGTGNSTFSEVIPSKNPGILCREAATGNFIWDRHLPDTVLARPSADHNQLFVGCLDGKAYSLDQRTGEINWSVEMEGPVYASPVVELDKVTGFAEVVYFASKFGILTAVSPYSGRRFWSAPLSYWTHKPTGDLSATPTLLRLEDDKTIRRRLYVGFGQGVGSTVPRLICVEDRTKK